MSNMRKALIYIDPGFSSGLGHYTNFANKISAYAKANSIELHHYVSQEVEPEDIDRFRLLPLFEHKAFLSEYDRNITEKIASFKMVVRDIFLEMKSRQDEYEEMAVYMYTGHSRYIEMFIALDRDYPMAKRSIHVVLFYLDQSILHEESDSSEAVRLAHINTRDEDDDIHIYIDSHRAIAHYQRSFTKRISTLPIPMYSTEDRTLKNSVKKDGVTIAFFGYALEKYGFHLFFELYRHLSSDKRYHFIVRLNRRLQARTFAAEIAELSEDANVHFSDRYLPDEEYKDLFRKSDIVVIPYLQEAYPVQTSGVFIDAVWSDKMVVAANNTWMSDNIDVLQNGMSFDSDDVASLRRAVIELSKGLDRAKDKKHIDDFKAYYSVEKMFETIFPKEDHE